MSTAVDLAVEFSSGIPVYRQIINGIYSRIGKGTLRDGDRLPTIRQLTEQLGVNPNTVAKAYRELDLKGVITSKRGEGCFVSSLKPGAPATLADGEKRVRLDEILGRLVTEAKVFGITEEEVLEHVAERMKTNEQVQ